MHLIASTPRLTIYVIIKARAPPLAPRLSIIISLSLSTIIYVIEARAPTLAPRLCLLQRRLRPSSLPRSRVLFSLEVRVAGPLIIILQPRRGCVALAVGRPLEHREAVHLQGLNPRPYVYIKPPKKARALLRPQQQTPALWSIARPSTCGQCGKEHRIQSRSQPLKLGLNNFQPTHQPTHQPTGQINAQKTGTPPTSLSRISRRPTSALNAVPPV